MRSRRSLDNTIKLCKEIKGSQIQKCECNTKQTLALIN